MQVALTGGTRLVASSDSAAAPRERTATSAIASTMHCCVLRANIMVSRCAPPAALRLEQPLRDFGLDFGNATHRTGQRHTCPVQARQGVASARCSGRACRRRKAVDECFGVSTPAWPNRRGCAPSCRRHCAVRPARRVRFTDRTAGVAVHDREAGERGQSALHQDRAPLRRRCDDRH